MRGREGDGPVDSQFDDLRRLYVDDLLRYAAELDRARASGDRETVRLLTHRLAGTAPSYGFETIGALALDCQEQLRAGASLELLGGKLARLAAAMRDALPSGGTEETP
jgi:HPt (histidine-containing phosphotransfer) domain-containing protein